MAVYQERFVSKDKEDYPWRRLVRSSAKRAVKLGLPFDLDDEWAKKRWTGRCELTDIAFAKGYFTTNTRSFFPSIDRIYPNKGYLKGNCRFILWAVNAMKTDGTEADMFRIAEALVGNRK
jgi:hypothetical protein